MSWGYTLSMFLYSTATGRCYVYNAYSAAVDFIIHFLFLMLAGGLYFVRADFDYVGYAGIVYL